MVKSKHKFQSFAEYLSYDDSTDKLYELFNGELIEMPPESGINLQIATFLLIQHFWILGYKRVRRYGLELEVRGEPRNRYPDLTIIREEHIQQLANRNTIHFSILPPLLVVEVVSSGELQRHRDFIAKRLQYQDCGIFEYWIIDTQNQNILVLELVDGIYPQIRIFAANNLIISPQFNSLNLTASQIFN